MVAKQRKVLTVSVAAYNVEDYIEQCLQPFAQDGVKERIEVLVVDDGGTDRTAEIAAIYQAQYPETIKVVHKENGGWGSTVNKAINLATGKYFKQLDGDDYFDKDKLIPFLDELEKTNADIVLTPFVTFISNTGEIKKITDPIEKLEARPYKEYNLTELKQNVNIAMHQCTFKTVNLRDNNIQLLENAFYTDVELVTKALYYSETVCLFPYIIYHYRVMRDGQSWSIDGMRKHYKEHEKVIFRIADFLKTMPKTSGYGLAFQRLKEMIYYQYYFYWHLKPSIIHQKELRTFDATMKNDYPELYALGSRKVRVLRNCHFILYLPLALWNWKKSK